MTHVERLLTEAIGAARQLGYRVDRNWLDGCGGGPCSAAGENWLFLDYGLTPGEQLNQLLSLLKDNSQTYGLGLSGELRAVLGLRKSA